MWDPAQYERFSDERSRPFRELVARVAHPEVRRVADVGCGPGALTAELAARWPAATVQGIDSSAEMIAAAAPRAVPGRLSFRQADLRDWEPAEPLDVLVSNATLQWVPGHIEMLEHFASFLAPGGVLAFQVPGNFEEPSHRLLAELRASERWRDKFARQVAERAGVNTPAEYLATLVTAGLSADVWETTYVQVLHGPDAVLEWMKGTALRPTLAALAPEDSEAFLAELGEQLRAAYPETEWGTVFPFRRIFAVARRSVGVERAKAGGSRIAALDHVQIAIPTGGEEASRAFYIGVLGLAETPKPAALAARGGCWFRGETFELHVGVDADFRSSRKAHVALAAEALDELATRLGDAGYDVTWDEELAPRRRFYTADPFGNRLELLEPLAAPASV
jgi:trans-aconitate 2-methyltransferase